MGAINKKPKPDAPDLPELGGGAAPEGAASDITTPESAVKTRSAYEPDRDPTLVSIYKVPVRVSAVLGKIDIDVASLMALEDGAVIELDRKVGEPIDIYANDRLIARGELVLVDGSLGVTLTEITHDDLC